MSYKLWHTMFMVAASALMPDLDTLQVDALKAIILAQQLQILSNDNEIEHLKLLVAKLRRMQFGRRSEKVTRQIEQLKLQLEELEANRAEVTAQTESQPPAQDASSSAKTPDRRRRPLPDHLPREVHTHIPRDEGSSYPPRLHDLRHTAAVHRIIAWYRVGADVQHLLPQLATYLGHKDLRGTQHYLSMTPELLEQACLRFQNYADSEGRYA
jgi:integrase